MSIELTTAPYSLLSSIRLALGDPYQFNNGSLSSIAPTQDNVSFIAGGTNNDLQGLLNTFILGSNISAPSPGYTYTNNLSSTGTIYAGYGNSNQWNSASNIVNTYGGTLISLGTTFPLSGAVWNNTTNQVNTSSVIWNTVATTSANTWNNTTAYVNLCASLWNQAANNTDVYNSTSIVLGNYNKWNTTSQQILLSSYYWNFAYQTVNNNYLNWNSAYNNAIYTVLGTPNQISVVTTPSNGSSSVKISLPDNINVNSVTAYAFYDNVGGNNFNWNYAYERINGLQTYIDSWNQAYIISTSYQSNSGSFLTQNAADQRYVRVALAQVYTGSAGASSIVPNNFSNNLASDYSTVGGGSSNIAGGSNSFIGGGKSNHSYQDYSVIGGGLNNAAQGIASVVAGGKNNRTSGIYSNTNGGFCNITSGNYSSIVGGISGTASGNYSAIAGGYCNTASGNYSVVAGGKNNTASGNYSFIAAGTNNYIANNVSNVNILGTGLSATQSNTTYVQSLISINNIVTPNISISSVNPLTYGNENSFSITGQATQSLYNQIQNVYAGISASTDVSLYNDTGANYLDMGINSSLYNGNAYYPTFNIVGPNDSYFYASTANLAQGTAGTTGDLIFFTGGSLSGTSINNGNERLRIVNTNTPNNGGFVGINTSTPNTQLTVNGSISANNTIYDQFGNSNNWNSAYASTTAINLSTAKWNGIYTSFNAATANTLTLNNLTISGSLYLQGSAYSLTTTQLLVGEPLIYLSENNPGDLYDIGFAGQYAANSFYAHTGLLRAHGNGDTGIWYLFSSMTTEPSAHTVATNNKSIDTLVANISGVTGTFTNSISAPALSGTHYGDGTFITGVSSYTTASVPANLTVTSSISAPALSGVFYGDGRYLNNVFAAIPANLTATSSISAPALSGTHYGNGTFLVGVSSYTTASVPANLTVTSSISAPALSGVFYGDGSKLINLPATAGALLSTTSGSFNAFNTNLTVNTLSANTISDSTGNSTKWNSTYSTVNTLSGVSVVVKNVSSYTVALSDTNTVLHFPQTATVTLSSLPAGFSVAVMNTSSSGTTTLSGVVGTGTKLSVQYASAFVYTDGTTNFAVGKLTL